MPHPHSGAVLLVEDHDLSAGLLVELLRCAFRSREIVRAATAALGFSEFVRLGPALVVIDVGLPDGSGIELARRMAAADPRALMVVHSSHDSDVVRDSVLAAGARAFVSKNEPAELIRVVGQLLRETPAIEISPQGSPDRPTDRNGRAA